MDGLKAGDRSVVEDAAEAAMLRYTDKLTSEPWAITRADVDEVKQQGFSDTDVLDMAQVAAYFAFVNRIADGLGVELEPHRRG